MSGNGWSRLPSSVAGACAVMAVLVIAGTTWAAGRQEVLTQWQFVVVAAGLGLGLVVVAGTLHAATLRRDGERRVEEALARLLLVAAEMPPPRPDTRRSR